MASSPPRTTEGESQEPNAKKSTASLLPAFEPFSSSPALPRPLKRTRDALSDNLLYPTPVPTSSTAILSSSPQPAIKSRPALARSVSALAERLPLSDVPSVQLEANGKPILIGRSSASCHYQMSANRLISRIHLKATYIPSLSRLDRDRVEILCTGWNGVKIHCQGQMYQLQKGETFSSDIRHAELMVDAHDARVMIQWPDKAHLGPSSSDEEEDSPSKKQRHMRRHSTPPSPSPLQARRRPISPVSPSPAVQALLPSSPPICQHSDTQNPVQIYEDITADEPAEEVKAEFSQSTQALSQAAPTNLPDTQESANDFSDNDEENDPIIHSFGPFGANLLPRMASFNAGGSPQAAASLKTSRPAHAEPLALSVSPAQPSTNSSDFDVQSHVINQLAFSRLSSTPISTIISHLPQEASSLSSEELKEIIHRTPCIGEVTREGKDAAGKPLESEYYYVPSEDEDEKRREAVVNDLMKPGLRACRKQHKQYFWRKPKKP